MRTEHATCGRCGHPIYQDSEGTYCPQCGPVLKGVPSGSPLAVGAGQTGKQITVKCSVGR